MAVLIDTNVLLDFFLKRIEFYSDAKEIVRFARKGEYEFKITPITLGTTYYLIRKQFSHLDAMALLQEFSSVFPCVNSSNLACQDALFMGLGDFEDAMQVAMAKSTCEMIITRNVADFKHCGMLVISPKDFLCMQTQND
jgi:predicted nucleic acid-binding protein